LRWPHLIWVRWDGILFGNEWVRWNGILFGKNRILVNFFLNSNSTAKMTYMHCWLVMASTSPIHSDLWKEKAENRILRYNPFIYCS
jgi:hypothetical protein